MANQLSFSPATITTPAGVAFNLDIWLDTLGAQIDGVDISLPLVGLQLVHVAYGTLMPLNHELDSISLLLFSEDENPGVPLKFAGAGVLCTLTLIATKSTLLALNFTPGATNDTNLIINGVDILSAVGSAQINVIPNSMPTNLPAGLSTVIQTWMTTNAPAAKLFFGTGSTYTPAPVVSPPLAVTGTITG